GSERDLHRLGGRGSLFRRFRGLFRGLFRGRSRASRLGGTTAVLAGAGRSGHATLPRINAPSRRLLPVRKPEPPGNPQEPRSPRGASAAATPPIPWYTATASARHAGSVRIGLHEPPRWVALVGGRKTGVCFAVMVRAAL